MNINKINASQTFYGKEQLLKEFSVKTFDGKNVLVKVNLNKGGNPQKMDCYVFNKNNKIIAGKGISRSPKLTLTEVIDFLNMIGKNIDNSVFEKFTKALSNTI